MTLFQTGSTLEAVDNNGSTCMGGGVGRPTGLSTPGQEFYANQSVLQSQMTMEGWDNSSGKKAKIVGVFTIVTVDDIQGTTIDRTSENENTRETENTSESTSESESSTEIEPADDGDTNTPPPNSGTGTFRWNDDNNDIWLVLNQQVHDRLRHPEWFSGPRLT